MIWSVTTNKRSRYESVPQITRTLIIFYHFFGPFTAKQVIENNGIIISSLCNILTWVYEEANNKRRFHILHGEKCSQWVCSTSSVCATLHSRMQHYIRCHMSHKLKWMGKQKLMLQSAFRGQWERCCINAAHLTNSLNLNMKRCFYQRFELHHFLSSQTRTVRKVRNVIIVVFFVTSPCRKSAKEEAF